ncbi:IS701 family transposase [Aureliella helgolandensis]|uniref:Transposase IS701-like DDE domain-containing protein n=2 Tax=Aureliella helgolandensis TaxID=2527968 RepID=A0A518G523_9BACT|nr:transposase [Aureliella helgolandensis]QDV23650.1 hypothetical protein Q31a_19540 [Aureliella helgolandensis]QDV27159.1 hypothetical protein Q31a_55460 [Aureliella helgolandensis]
MDITTSFMPLLQVFTAAMTEPTAQSFKQFVAGWIFAPRRNITGALRAIDPTKHHSAYHRIFAGARWSIDQVGLAMFDLVVKLTDQQHCYLVGDDTLIHKTGLKIYGTGMHRDASQSSSGFTSFRWGHCWVVLCVLVPSRKDPTRKYAIPVLMRLYLNTKTNKKLRRKHRKKTDLMLEMIQLLTQHAGEKSLHFLGDSAYTGGRMLEQIPSGMHVTGRIGKDARLCEGPRPKKPGRGRPPRRGPVLPKPTEMLATKGLRRTTINLYSQSSFHVRITSVVCRLYLAPEREVKVVAVEHLRGGRGIEVFYSTDVNLSEEEILQRFSFRWPVETTFQEAKGHLGLGEPQNRVRAAVRRTTPSMFYLYGLIVLWHEHVRPEPGPFIRMWRGKRHASFADMLATLRRDSVEETRQSIFSAGRLPPAAQKLIKPLEVLLSLAA